MDNGVDQPFAPITPMGPSIRWMLAAVIIMVVVALLIGALTIPFLFESPSMYYKFGWNKTLLRSGKMVGLTAALFIMLQLPLAVRLKMLDRIFSLPALYTVHRYQAKIILALVIIHPIAVFVPDGTLMIPLEMRYWPEWVGAALLLVILLQYGFSHWRRSVFKRYEKWLYLHRVMGLAAMAMLVVHILYVSETFEHAGLPRNLVMLSAVAIVALWCWVRIQPWVQVWTKPMTVKTTEAAGENAHTIRIEPHSHHQWGYVPGQFSFLWFESTQISKEPHPFTLSSSPSRPNTLEFTIRRCGDWTNRINTIEPGDKVYVQGPFGHFSHLYVPPTQDLIMIAGGIGITPMLSMLRYMSDVRDTRRIKLLWSNQTPRHAFKMDELKSMEEKLTGFSWIPIFTREKGDEGHFGRLDRHALGSMLQSDDRKAAIFLCGPPPMIQQVRLDLEKLGFSDKSIHFEAFGL